MNTPDPNPPPEPAPEFNTGKRRAALVSLALIVAVLLPIRQNWRTKPRDDFPFSYYPMFSNKRDAIETFYYMLGRDAQGARHQIPFGLIGDGGGNQVRRQLRRIINEGRAPELAKTVAKRVSKRNTHPWPEVVSVAVCRGKYDLDAWFHGKKEPVSEQVKGIAQVERKTP